MVELNEAVTESQIHCQIKPTARACEPMNLPVVNCCSGEHASWGEHVDEELFCKNFLKIDLDYFPVNRIHWK